MVPDLLILVLTLLDLYVSVVSHHKSCENKVEFNENKYNYLLVIPSLQEINILMTHL